MSQFNAGNISTNYTNAVLYQSNSGGMSDQTLRDALERFIEELVEQGDEHVKGCMGQADCAACVHHDLLKILAAHPKTPQAEPDAEGLGDHWLLFKRHRSAGAYLPVGQLDGDCRECGHPWPCEPIQEVLAALTEQAHAEGEKRGRMMTCEAHVARAEKAEAEVTKLGRERDVNKELLTDAMHEARKAHKRAEDAEKALAEAEKRGHEAGWNAAVDEFKVNEPLRSDHPAIEKARAEGKAEAEAVRDREFGNLRWMDGHARGLLDGKAEADAEWTAKVESLSDNWEQHSKRFTAPTDRPIREDWEFVARTLRALIPADAAAALDAHDAKVRRDTLNEAADKLDDHTECGCEPSDHLYRVATPKWLRDLARQEGER